MKRLLIVTSGILPVPAVKGGAIENRIEYLIQENEQKPKYDIIVVSINDEMAKQRCAMNGWKYTSVLYITLSKFEKFLDKYVKKIANRFPCFHIPTEGVFILKIKSCMKKKDLLKIDKILIENSPTAVIWLSKRIGAKYYLHLGNDVLNENILGARTICERLEKILTVSNYIKNRTLTIDSLEEQKVCVIPQGTKIEEFMSADASREGTRKKLGIERNDVVFMYCGRIDPAKGIKEALLAFCNLQYENCKFLIIGAKSVWALSDDFSNELKEIAEEKKDKIIFTGYIAHEQMPYYYKAADVAVLTPTWQEAGGNTIVEAVVAGLPLITTDSGGNRDYCDESCAVILPQNEQLVQNIEGNMRRLYEDKELRSQMHMNAINFSRSFSAENHARAVFNALR